MIEELSLDYPAVCIRLYLDLAQIVSQMDTEEKVHDELQYDICSEALELFQDEISDNKEKKVHLQYIIGALMNITNMTEENIESLFRNCTSYASSMLKKHDKVIMLCKVTHLYHSNACKDETRINEILRKSLKIAKNSVRRKPDSAFVYIHILDKIVFFYDAGISSIGTDEINACIKIIKENIETVSDKVKDSMTLSLSRITGYLSKRKSADAEKWGAVEL